MEESRIKELLNPGLASVWHGPGCTVCEYVQRFRNIWVRACQL